MTQAPPQMLDEKEATRALFEAAGAGDAAGVARLLADGAHADSHTAAGGETPLMRAAARGHEEVARALLDAGADASARRADGFTPLILAVFFGHERIARLLVERGADAGARTSLGTSAAGWAAARGFGMMTGLLREAEAAAPPTPAPVATPDAQAAAEDVPAAPGVVVVAPAEAAAVAGAPAPASDEVSIFSRKAGPRAARAADAPVPAASRVTAAAARAAAGRPPRPEADRAVVPRREEEDSRGRLFTNAAPAGVTLRLGEEAPAHPSASVFRLGDFLRSWQGAAGAAMLLLAFGVAVYALVSGGANPRPAAAPAATPTPSQAAAQPPAAVTPQPATAYPTPDASGVVPLTDPAFVAPGAAGQPFYVPQPAPYVPPSTDVPRDLTVVSESGAPPANENAGARRRAESNSNANTPARGEGREGAAAAARPARTPDAEQPRPAPPAAQPTQPPPPAPQPTPGAPKVIRWPPQ